MTKTLPTFADMRGILKDDTAAESPVASATRDEERERLLAELGPWRDRGRVGRAAAMIEADGKRIAELEAECAELHRIAIAAAHAALARGLLELKPPKV